MRLKAQKDKTEQLFCYVSKLPVSRPPVSRPPVSRLPVSHRRNYCCISADMQNYIFLLRSFLHGVAWCQKASQCCWWILWLYYPGVFLFFVLELFETWHLIYLKISGVHQGLPISPIMSELEYLSVLWPAKLHSASLRVTLSVTHFKTAELENKWSSFKITGSIKLWSASRIIQKNHISCFYKRFYDCCLDIHSVH